MNVLDWFQQLVTAVTEQLGVFVQLPSFVLGLGLVVLSAVIVSRANSGTSFVTRVVAGAALVVGLPILLTSIRVGTTDALLWSILALLASGIWLISAKGRIVTLVGVVVTVIAVGALINVTHSNPSGSAVADSLRLAADWTGRLWTAITA